MARLEVQPRLEYINNLFAKEDENQKAIKEQLRLDHKEGINVGPYEGKLLFFLSQMIGAKKIVEIGTLYGYSTSWFLRALPSDGFLYTLEKSEETALTAKSLLKQRKNSEQMELLVGDARENLQSITDKGPFDLIFIDANKAAYGDYLDWAIKHIKKGGLIIGDNTYLFGHVYDDKEASVRSNEKQIKVMKEFNQRLAESDEFTSVMLPTPEGMTLALKK